MRRLLPRGAGGGFFEGAHSVSTSHFVETQFAFAVAIKKLPTPSTNPPWAWYSRNKWRNIRLLSVSPRFANENLVMGRAFEVRKLSMAKTAAAKTKVYSKYGKQIYVLAKNTNPDPEANTTLRGLIEKAKKDQVPAHVIEKALEKASGSGGEDYSVARYEGFGPGGCSVIVDCLSDNANRTITDVRNCFTKTGAKMGAPGSVAHMFDHLAVLSLKSTAEEEVLEALLAADVDVTDVEVEDGQLTVFAPATAFYEAKQALLQALPDTELEVEEITFLPQSRVELAADDVPMFEKFLALLNDCDDVQDVYHNATLPT